MKKKKAISFILTLAMIFTMAAGFTTVGFVETAEDAYATVYKYTKLGFDSSYDFDTGVLFISGSGILPSEVTSSLFPHKTSATSIEIDPRIEELPNNAFNGWSNVTTVTALGVTKIGNSAFKECRNLTIVSMPALTTIDYDAFQDCTSLTTVNMPAVTAIERYVFKDCTSLSAVSVAAVTTIKEGTFQGCTSLTEMNLPAVTIINNYAFQGCTSLETVSMPNVVTIENATFDGTSLTAISVPSATAIGNEAFKGCTRLATADLPAVTTIEDHAFEECTSLTTVTMPAVTTIGNNAFNGCTSLTEISFGTVPTSVADTAFKNVSSSGIIKVPRASLTSFEAIHLIVRDAEVSTDSAVVEGWHYVTEAAEVPEVPPIHHRGGGNKVVTTQPVVETTQAAVDIPVIPFTDVEPGVWYESAANFCAKHGIINGIIEGLFCGSQNTGRGQIVTMLSRLENITGQANEKYTAGLFADVSVDDYYADSIAWAAKNNIVKGMGSNNFGPSIDITREQLATILYNYAKYRNLNTGLKADAGLTNYADASSVSSYATEAMRWASENGIITGINNADGVLLNPQGTATRAEIAAMIMRLCTSFNGLI